MAEKGQKLGLAERYERANSDFRNALGGFLTAEGIDLSTIAANRRSALVELVYNDKSRPGIPGILSKLAHKVYDDHLTIKSIQAALVYVSGPQLAGDECYTTAIHINVNPPKSPSPIGIEQGFIGVGSVESYLSRTIEISPDLKPHVFLVEAFPMIREPNTTEPQHFKGAFSPAIIEAVTKIFREYPRRESGADVKELLNPPTLRAIRAAGALRAMILPRMGIATEPPSVRCELYS